MNFGGASSQRMPIPNGTIPHGDMTFSCWARIPVGASAPNAAFGCGSAIDSELCILYFNSSLSASYQLQVTWGGNAGAGTAIRDGLWHHIALRRAGTLIEVFLDTVLNITVTSSNQPKITQQELGNARVAHS
jgi:hypothetical protein